MFTLILRFAAPLQSWGSGAKFETRRTELFPTRSGIIGLLAAALGFKRNQDLDQFNHLQIGVKTVQPGTVIRDLHTARKDQKTSYMTQRYYLADAVFEVGIASADQKELEELEQALKRPAYPLFLGRRSCPPEQPLVLGLEEGELREVLQRNRTQNPQKEILLYLENTPEGKEMLMRDVPESFSPEHRKYSYRKLSEISLGVEEHDPFMELEENE